MRGYGDHTATPLRSFRTQWQRRATAFVLRMLKVRAVGWHSMQSHSIHWECHVAAEMLVIMLSAPWRSAFSLDNVGSP